MMSCCYVSPSHPLVKQAISQWLGNEIPEWKDMQIGSRGKYLGVYPGAGGCEKTYAACEEKYLSRCFDLSLNVASGLPTIVEYSGSGTCFQLCFSSFDPS